MLKYKPYKIGTLYQVEFNERFGYVQEVGEYTLDGYGEYPSPLVVVYIDVFDKPIQKIGELDGKKYYLAEMIDTIQRQCNDPNNTSFMPTPTDKGIRFRNFVQDIRTLEEWQEYFYVSSLGEFPISKNIEIPEVFRKLDYNGITDKHKWILYSIYETDKGKTRQSSKGIEHLPPSSFILAFIVDWWKKGLTPEKWNDEYLQNENEELYRHHPHKRPFKMTFEEVVATMPTKEWSIDGLDEWDGREKFYAKIEEVLRGFIKELSAELKIKLNQARKVTKEVTLKLNAIQSEEHCIETMEGEQIHQFIFNLLRAKKVVDAIEELEEHRDW